MNQDKYQSLNESQREAVITTEGPVLMLAGAGSGKTRALTHRIAWLIEKKGVSPWNILAITFTNKAAGEMRSRVGSLAENGDSVWVATFHSSCARILRRYIDRLGYDTDFTIYDADDQKSVLKNVIKELNLDPKLYRERPLQSFISACKDELLTPAEMRTRAAGDYRKSMEAKIYAAYQQKCAENNAVDFDDLLMLTVQLFRENPDVLESYQERFRYILVDEYQDTNHAQFEFVSLLAKKYGNLCVVGDDDQSIYRFRGADIRNILEFEQVFPGAKVIRLEQNYRSTSSILNCANAVIANNRDRKKKTLWSERGEGEPVRFKQYENGYEEAEEVIREIRRDVLNGGSYNDYAILYRTNAQSRSFEEACIGLNVPYRMVGGVNFYQRAEIKDLLAYLKTIAGGKDDLATERILNVPKRGIGRTTVDKLLSYGENHGFSLMETIRRAPEVKGIERALPKLRGFSEMIGGLKELVPILPFDELIGEIISRTDYYDTLEDLDEEKQQAKRENIEELMSKASDFCMKWEEEHGELPSLTAFLEEVALVADVDSMDSDEPKLLLMTLHSSKGLEFPNVYLVGMEDGLFPSYMAISGGDPTDLEEERRLCYVGITRAMNRLTLTAAKCRTLRGEVSYNMVSRFVKEIPDELLGLRKNSRKKTLPENLSVPGSAAGARPADTRNSPAARKKLTPSASKDTFGKSFEVKKAPSLSYTVGDRVSHMKFGIGTVLDIIEGKKDYEVTVSFDTEGERRMFASFAKLKKEE